jgi:hypothetical protein
MHFGSLIGTAFLRSCAKYLKSLVRPTGMKFLNKVNVMTCPTPED